MNKQIKIILAQIILILIALFLFIIIIATIMGITPVLIKGFIIDCFFILIALIIVIMATIAHIIFGNKEKK